MTSMLTDITWQIGPLLFNGTDTNGVTWAVNSAGTSGWYDGPGVRLNQTPIPRYDGAYRADSYRGPRSITIPGWATAPSKPVAQLARQTFCGLYPLGKQTTLTVVDGTETRTMQVELADQPKARPHANGLGFDFQLTLSAVDPRKYGPSTQGQTGLPSVAQSGLTWGTPPGSGPGLAWGTPPGSGAGLVWGNYGSNGVVTLVNAGTADAWPIFTVQGPISSPSITDSAGNVLAWTGPALAATDQLVLTSSPFARSVLLNGGDNRASLTTAQWAPIAAGSAQTYQFQGSSAGSPVLTATVSPAYW